MREAVGSKGKTTQYWKEHGPARQEAQDKNSEQERVIDRSIESSHGCESTWGECSDSHGITEDLRLWGRTWRP